MIQSFEADATKALLELTARSVMSPLKHKRSKNKEEKRISKSLWATTTYFMSTAAGQAKCSFNQPDLH